MSILTRLHVGNLPPLRNPNPAYQHNVASFRLMFVTSRVDGRQADADKRSPAALQQDVSSTSLTTASRLPTLPEEETSEPKTAAPVAALREAADGKDDSAEV